MPAIGAPQIARYSSSMRFVSPVAIIVRVASADHLECGAGDFRPDAVTRQNEYPQGH